MKVQFNENIHDMSQCQPNPGLMSIKVQNVDFLNVFPYFLLLCYHHLGTKMGTYIALCIFLNF